MCAFEYHIFFRYHIIGDIFGRKFQLKLGSSYCSL
jgi:hypothetical protein